MKKKILIILLSLILIPLIVIILYTIKEQFQSIKIEGKGDTGHERSIEYPFICTTGFFPGSQTVYYCDYKKFTRQTFNKWKDIIQDIITH